MSVSIITCTNRKQFINNIFANYHRQVGVRKELIIILNKDDMDINFYRKTARKYKNISIFQLPQRISLGHCLNFAVKKAKYPLIAKFDDDDYYAPYYLHDSIRVFRNPRIDIIGKCSHYAYLESRDLLVIRLPNRENRFIRFVTGATFIIRKRVFNYVQFANVSQNEDGIFLQSCCRKGLQIYSTDRRNYVCIRRANKNTHTWKVKDSYILRGSKIVAYTKNYRLLIRRK
ncbi:MAG TPA: glycosyltransferase [Bacillota bacterium]|nr:glycosyltransferase [Bacillota bacterium]